MAEENKALVKSSIALVRFDPKARNELVVRGLVALAEVRDADFYCAKGEAHRIKATSLTVAKVSGNSSSSELRQALDNYEKALRIDPKHEDSLFWVGYCYLAFDEPRYKRGAEGFQAMINIIEKAGNLSRDDCVMYYNLGVAQRHLGLYKEATESFKKAIELNPDDADSYSMLAECQAKIGLTHLASENYEKYRRLKPINYLPKVCPNCAIKYGLTRDLEIHYGRVHRLVCPGYRDQEHPCRWPFEKIIEIRLKL